MTEIKGKKFIASYSGGKDSALALYRAIQAGLIPHKLITTYNTDLDRSWFHGIMQDKLEEISTLLNIPIELIKTSGADYEHSFEAALSKAKAEGAEICVFGDIDIEEHLNWCTKRCENAGIQAYFPLWQQNRAELVYEFINLGFKAVITVINTDLMPKEFIGKVLTQQTAKQIGDSGADICGENGEYHTFVFDGPIFLKNIEYNTASPIQNDNYLVLPIL